MARVVVTGSTALDFVFSVQDMPTRPEKYKADDVVMVGGGVAANAAVAVSRLGGQAILGARLGDDFIADMILSDLTAEGVDTSFVDRAVGGKSAFSSIYVDSTGERQIVAFRGSGLNNEPEMLDRMPKAGAYLSDTRWDQATMRAMQLARQHGVPGIIDGEAPVNLDVIKNASHVAFSRQGLVELTGLEDMPKALAQVAQTLDAWLCVTDGEAGVWSYSKGQHAFYPAFAVPVTDTLGAGDIWHGAFALRLAEGTSEPEAVRFACAAAALKCMEHGGRKGCPDRAKTMTFLQENS